MRDADRTDIDLERHLAATRGVAGVPIRRTGVELFEDGLPALEAMWAAIAAARRSVLLEYYTFEDITVGGRSLVELLLERLAAGVTVAVIYDAIGSSDTPDRVFDRLRAAGGAVMAFHGTRPFAKHFSLRLNDRDHRKILVADGRTLMLGGVNIDRQYLNPRANGIPPDRNTKRAFWQDCAAMFGAAAATDGRDLFLSTWRAHGGDPLALPPDDAPAPDGEDVTSMPAGGEALVAVEGSAPREGRPLHLRALFASLEAARSRVLIASGYFVPMPSELRALAATAARGVEVRLVLPGVSDVPGVVHAARATYGRLLEAGVRIREARHSVLHAKVSTVDGVWSSIGSSNLDRRSAVMNNEVDAVVLDRDFAGRVERMIGSWFDAGAEVTLARWRARSFREHLGELAALGWKRLM